VAKPAYEWRLERAGGGDVVRLVRDSAAEGALGSQDGDVVRGRQGGSGCRSKGWQQLGRRLATKGARSGKRFVRRGLTRRATKCGSVSSAPGPEKNGRPGHAADLALPRRGNATRAKPPETEVEATPNTAGRHSPTVLVTRDRSATKGAASTPSWTAAITPQRRLDKGDALRGRDGHPTACRRRAGIRRFTGYSLKTQPAAEDGKRHLSHREAGLRIGRREE
jgi:hypothetical protein